MTSKLLKTSRRGFLQGSVGAAGLIALPLGATVSVTENESAEVRAQNAYIEAVLFKHTGASRQINKDKIRVFAQRFTQTYGLVDYRRMYSGMVGEYQLTRLYVRSAYKPA